MHFISGEIKKKAIKMATGHFKISVGSMNNVEIMSCWIKRGIVTSRGGVT